MESKLSPQFLVLLSLSLLGVSVSDTITDKYAAVGDDIILTPTYSGTMNKVTWYHSSDRTAIPSNHVVGWDGNTPTYYSIFKDKTTLDTSTAHLTISSVDRKYSGQYMLEVNQLNQAKFQVYVIDRVTKPTIVYDTSLCNSDSISCSFTCKATSLEEAQPVTYWWKGDDGDWMERHETSTLSNKELKNSLKIFCRVKNPISEELSEPVENIMHKKDHTGIIAGSVVGIVVLIAVVIVIWKKDAIKNLFTQQTHDKVAAG